MGCTNAFIFLDECQLAELAANNHGDSDDGFRNIQRHGQSCSG